MTDALIVKCNSSVPLVTVCPLPGAKRTSVTHALMSAYDPKRTFLAHFAVSIVVSVETKMRWCGAEDLLLEFRIDGVG
jgi:hypothetical protein